MRLSRAEVNAIPEQWLGYITQFLLGFNNTSIDFTKPHLRPTIKHIYPLFVFIYALLIIVGTISNLIVIAYIVRYRLHRDPTYCFIINLALCDIIKCVCVLPITLMVLLIQNWIFGQFLCFFLPMLQDIPLHVSTLSFLLIAVDRFRLVKDPMKPRLPAFVCAMGTWLLSVCIVLPYPIYITYLDLGLYIKSQFDGVGICVFNLVDDMQEYMRGLFLVMYVAPLSTIAYLYVRVSREMQTHEGPLAVMMFEARSRDISSRSRSRTDSHSTGDFRGSHQDYDGSVRGSDYSRNSYQVPRDLNHYQHHRHFDIVEAELDVCKEKRTQKYLISMVTMFAICLCPLMILRLARLAMIETYENSVHFDITYTMFVWIAFLPTCSTPILFASWQMSRPAKERLRGYFRFSNRKLRRSCEAVVNSNITVQTTDLRSEPSLGGSEDRINITENNRFGHNRSSRSNHSCHSSLTGSGQLVHHGSTRSTHHSQRSSSGRVRSCSSGHYNNGGHGSRVSSNRGSVEGRRSTDSVNYQQDFSSS